jgi:hypothetical protein
MAAAAVRRDLVAGRPDPEASDGGGDNPGMGSLGLSTSSVFLFILLD